MHAINGRGTPAKLQYPDPSELDGLYRVFRTQTEIRSFQILDHDVEQLRVGIRLLTGPLWSCSGHGSTDLRPRVELVHGPALADLETLIPGEELAGLQAMAVSTAFRSHWSCWARAMPSCAA